MQRLMIHLSVLLSALGVSVAQDTLPLDQGASGLFRMLKRLQNTASVLHVVAHPDDEDGPLLAYCARGEGVRTMLFSITRGEGGANLIAPYFFDELGALRSLEHDKAASYYGNELYYSHATDYGFSKTLREARRQWRDGEPILRDLVELVRRERPTIILSRFRGDRRDGHGHHQMAGVLSQQVFEAAADPGRFPEQLQAGLRPWQVKKLYANNIRPGRRSEDMNAWTIAIPTGQYNALLGRSYAQIARFGLGFQRSQGISGHIGAAGPQQSYYRLLRAAGFDELPSRESSLLDGVNTRVAELAKLAGSSTPAELSQRLQDIEDSVTAAVNAFDTTALEKTTKPLVEGLAATRRLLGQLVQMPLSDEARFEMSHRLRQKAAEFQQAISHSLGMAFDAWATTEEQASQRSFFGGSQSGFNYAIPGQEFISKVRFVNRSSIAVQVNSIKLETPSDWSTSGFDVRERHLGPSELLEASASVQLGNDAAATQPNWQRDSIREPFYSIEIPDSWHQRPLPEPPLHAVANLTVGGVSIDMRRAVEVRIRHPEYGQVRHPLTVVPAISVRFATRDGVLPVEKSNYEVEVTVRSAVKGAAHGTLKLSVPDGWRSDPEIRPFDFSREDEEATFTFRLIPADDVQAQRHTIRAVASFLGRDYSSGYRTITARDLNRVNLYRDAVHRLQTVDATVLGRPRIGYIMGSGDEVPQTLGMFGFRAVMLGHNDLATGDLSQFDLILVGVRAYAVRPDIRKHNARLIDFVQDGGVMIVQYQTPEFDHNFGPYPYQMARRPEEVSEEDSKVTILEPDHVVFRTPNPITEADFDGWLEQRGSKFWSTWDDRYTALLECHDTGQSSQKGGMLAARYGKGVYIYSAYAWYRQLPHGVGGAFRIFANMLSLPSTLAGADDE